MLTLSSPGGILHHAFSILGGPRRGSCPVLPLLLDVLYKILHFVQENSMSRDTTNQSAAMRLKRPQVAIVRLLKE